MNIKPKMMEPRDVNQGYYNDIMMPLLNIPKEDIQKDIKQIFNAIEILINNNGDIEKCDAEVMQQRKVHGQDFAISDSLYEMAKRLFWESEYQFTGKQRVTN